MSKFDVHILLLVILRLDLQNEIFSSNYCNKDNGSNTTARVDSGILVVRPPPMVFLVCDLVTRDAHLEECAAAPGLA